MFKLKVTVKCLNGCKVKKEDTYEVYSAMEAFKKFKKDHGGFLNIHNLDLEIKIKNVD